MSSLLDKPDRILYTAEESPPLPTVLLLAVTHVALIFDAVVFIPNVLGKVTGASREQVQFACFVTILVSAVATLVQVLRVGRIGTGFILFMGSYSAFLSCSIEAANLGGLALVATLTVLTAPCVFFFAYFLRVFRHIVTPAVGGVVILLVAINLVPIGLELWQGGNPAQPGFGSLENYLVGCVTMATLLLLLLFGNRTIRLWTPLLGMGSGYAAAACFGLLNLTYFHQSAWFGLPDMAWPGLAMPFELEYLPVMVAFFMAALAGSIEGTGNIMLVQTVSRRDQNLSYGRIQSGLFCDGFGKLASGLGGGAPISTYCDNIPLIEMTGVASRSVGICGAVLLGILAFIPKAGGVILDMPGPVVGGMLISIAAMLFFSGIGLVTRNGLNNQTGLMVGISIVVAMIAEADIFFPNLMPVRLSPLLQNGVAMGGFTAFLISALIHILPRKKVSFAVPGKTTALPEIVEALKENSPRLRMTESQVQRMELALEEVFMHFLEGNDSQDCTVLFKLKCVEDGIFTEAIMGGSVNQVVNLKPPRNLMSASDDSLDDLGMFLLSNIVKDIRHIELSGTTYFSFIV